MLILLLYPSVHPLVTTIIDPNKVLTAEYLVSSTSFSLNATNSNSGWGILDISGEKDVEY